MKENIKSAVKISSSFLGALIGAGFASGQEILVYFCSSGHFGTFAIALCLILFFALISGICLTIRRTHTKNFRDFLLYTCGQKGARIFMAIFLLSTFVAFGAMTSGCGASLEQHIGIPSQLGGAFFLIIMIIIIRAGERGVVSVNTILTPVMIICVLFVCVYILIKGSIPTSAASQMSAAKSAILYVGYNGIIGIAVIAQLSHLISSRLTGLISALTSTAAFAALLIPLYAVTMQNITSLSAHSIPMLYAASQIHEYVGHIYFSVLIMAMVTTGGCCGFSLCGSLNINPKKGALLLPILSVPFIFVDFSFLVSRLYALFGVAGALLLFIILYRSGALLFCGIREKKRHK